MSIAAGRINLNFWILILIAFPGYGFQMDPAKSLVMDLSNGWMIYENGNLRLLTPDETTTEAIHFYLNKKTVEEVDLLMKIPKSSSLWVDNKLYQYFEKDTIIITPLDQFLEGETEQLVTVFGKTLNRENLSTWLVKSSYAETNKVVERNSAPFKNYLLLSFFAGMFLTAYFKMNSSVTIQEYFALGRTFAMRSRDELLFKSKLLSTPNPIFYLVISFFASFLITALMVITPETFSINFNLSTASLGRLLGFQGLTMLGFYFWIILKWIILRYMSWLFNLLEFSPIHFFNYERYSFLFLLLVSGISFIAYFTLGSHSDIFPVIVPLIILAATFRIVLIILKLLNASSYKILHLFSYLCATEIIPYLFAIKLILI